MNINNDMELQNFSGSFRIKKETILLFLSVFFYKIILEFSYVLVIYKDWSYKRLILNLDPIKLIESYILLFIIFLLLPKEKKVLSYIFIWIMILLSYIPLSTIYAFTDKSRIFMYSVTLYWIFIILFLKIPEISITFIKKSQANIIFILIFIYSIIICFLLIYKYLGFSININLFDLMSVYEIREQYSKITIPFKGVYLINWMAYIINPIFFTFFIIKKKWLPLLFIMIIQFFLFTGTGHKSYFFALLYVLILIWIVSNKNTIKYLAIILIIIILVGIITRLLFDDIVISSLFIRRTLLGPANLSFLYYDFFSTHEHTYLSQSIFRYFVNYPYSMTPGHIIAKEYFNDLETNSPTGLLAASYMNFGFLGFLFSGFLLLIVLKTLDSFSKNKDIRLGIAAIAMPTITLINSAILTTLLSHGLLLTLLLLYLLPEKEKINYLD